MQNTTLNPDQIARIQRMRHLARRMDAQWQLGGVRIGYDSLIGLIPGFGDILTALIALNIINHARKLNVPKTLLGRMLFNVAAEMLVGEVPVVGDVVDVLWRANLRNVALVERHFMLESKSITDDAASIAAHEANSFPLWLGVLLLLMALLTSVLLGIFIWLIILNILDQIPRLQAILNDTWWNQ